MHVAAAGLRVDCKWPATSRTTQRSRDRTGCLVLVLLPLTSQLAGTRLWILWLVAYRLGRDALSDKSDVTFSESHPGKSPRSPPSDSQTMSRDMRQLPFAVAGGSGCMFIVRRATEKLVRHTKMLIDFIHSIYRLCDDIISKSSPQNGHFYLSSTYVNFFDASGH